ncbi:hypothetical protein DEI86_06640 [Curtobacterium sp. MCBD17_028]|nr:hypothetical protein DEI86_06640 [Curtobacterium sp. MCBD17_028]
MGDIDHRGTYNTVSHVGASGAAVDGPPDHGLPAHASTLPRSVRAVREVPRTTGGPEGPARSRRTGMTNRPEGDERATRNERRAAARIRAQQARARQKRRQRGVRIGLQAGLVVVLIAIVAVVSIVLVRSVQPAGPGPAHMAGGGITIGQGLRAVGAGRGDAGGAGRATSSASASAGSSGTASATPSASATGDASGAVDVAGTVHITMYIDYLCPICGQFEHENNAYIRGLVTSGAATVEIHPIAILTNRSQGTKYSLRAANAAACVANSSPDQFFAVNQALYAEQPEENTKGLDDAQLRHLVAGVHGIRHLDAIERCIDTQRYAAWVDARTNDVLTHGVPGTGLRQLTGTPTIFVNGKRYDYSLPFTNAEFRTFVVTAAGSTYASGDETPVPTPTPTATSSAG